MNLIIGLFILGIVIISAIGLDYLFSRDEADYSPYDDYYNNES
jgi:hypothetical protein